MWTAFARRSPPFSPDAVVEEFSAILKSYGIREVRGDRYAGLWPTDRFAAHGIDYLPAERPKSDLYRDVLPLLNSRRVELLDLPRLKAQLVSLERRTSRGGRDSIDAAQGRPEDVANAVSGAVVLAAGGDDFVSSWLRADFSLGGSVMGISPPPRAATPAAGGDVIELRLHNGVERKFNFTRRCWADAMPDVAMGAAEIAPGGDFGIAPAPPAPAAPPDVVSYRLDPRKGDLRKYNFTRHCWDDEIVGKELSSRAPIKQETLAGSNQSMPATR